MVEGDRPKTVGIEKIRARSRILVDRDDQRAAIARQVRALDIPLGLEHGHAFAGRQIAPDEESELAAVVGGVVELRPFVGKGLRLSGDGLSLFGNLDQLALGSVIYLSIPVRILYDPPVPAIPAFCASLSPLLLLFFLLLPLLLLF